MNVLRAAGFNSVIAPLDTPKGLLYRVRVGPYGSAVAADAALGQLQHQGYPGARRVID